MAEVVYVLCLLTSIACAALLLTGYRRGHARLLLWSGLCFSTLALNNVILLFDRVFLPNMDLVVPRAVTMIVALALLLYGFVWEEA